MARTGRTVCKEACCCPENPDELFAPLVWSVAAGFNSFFQFTSLFLLPLIFSLSSLHFSLLPSRQATDFHRALCSFAFYARTHSHPLLERRYLLSSKVPQKRTVLAVSSWTTSLGSTVKQARHRRSTCSLHDEGARESAPITLLVVYDVVNESEADYYKIISIDANARSLVQNMIQCQCNVRCRKCVRRSNPLSCRAILGKGILVDVLFKHVVQRQFRRRRFN